MAKNESEHEPLPPRAYVRLCDPLTTPPMSESIRNQVGILLRRLQRRESLGPTQFKIVREIGPGCGEIRLVDGELNKEWRIFVCLTPTEVIVLERLEKRSQKTPKQTIDLCRRRLSDYRENG